MEEHSRISFFEFIHSEFSEKYNARNFALKDLREETKPLPNFNTVDDLKDFALSKYRGHEFGLENFNSDGLEALWRDFLSMQRHQILESHSEI